MAWFMGCSDSSTPPPPPGVQPEIINITDSFEYQIQSISGYSGTASYTWQNSGAAAAVDHSSVVSAGVGTLIVLDADGTEVYSDVLTDSGSFVTQSGTAGAWTVRITYTTFSGTVNFRVQKS
jgi:hypothetical protein